LTITTVVFLGTAKQLISGLFNALSHQSILGNLW